MLANEAATLGTVLRVRNRLIAHWSGPSGGSALCTLRRFRGHWSTSHEKRKQYEAIAYAIRSARPFSFAPNYAVRYELWSKIVLAMADALEEETGFDRAKWLEYVMRD